MAHRHDKFYTWLKMRLGERDRPVTLEELASAIAKFRQMDVGDLKSRARSRHLLEARRLLLLLAVEHGIASRSDVARFLGRSPSTLHGVFKTAHNTYRSGRGRVSLDEILKGPTATSPEEDAEHGEKE